MELRRHQERFEAAGIKLFAVSYDPVDALANFAEEHSIEYPLLSDEGSEVIRQFGILNTLIGPDEPVHGIPFPGSYLVAEDGTVAEKFFHRQYQIRETGPTVLHSGFGVPIDLASVPRAEATSTGAKVSVALGARDLSMMQRAELYVRIELDEGLHLYGQPIPDGFYATEVRVTGPDGLRFGEPQYPPTRPFHVEGLDEEFHVFEGDIEIALSLTSAVREGDSIPIDVEVSYQACNDRECFTPTTERLHLDVPLGQSD